ncbi:MAG: Gfo/Idh/MocA family oxidoreductase [Tannerella sp.]|jgi:predicted dehydrogenase|nr:Gfo/Idh/MocA family oxidoreductase [Tannerella sp.]
MKELLNVNRRGFLKGSALGVLGTMSVPAIITSCTSPAGGEKLKDVAVTEIMDQAPDGNPLKAGLVGCGGRGTGAAVNFIQAGNGLQVTAIGDVFEDKVLECRQSLKARGVEIADDKCFVGFDAFKKVIDSDVDVVLLCSPPMFRPEHFDYVVEKGKHCFIEKPCATDPTGVRQIIVAGKRFAQKGLTVVNGLCYRSAKDKIETWRRVGGGAIGDIVSAHVSRMGGSLWFRKREKGWSDTEYILRNWTSFCATSGDFVVEQFVHEMDLMKWYMGDILPVSAEANGGRQRRVTGDMYDHFSITYVFENGVRAHCTSRQIDGCDNQTVTMLYGTKGYVNVSNSKIYNYDGTIAWEYPRPRRDDPDQTWAVPDMYRQEHVRMVNAIRTGKPLNETDIVAQVTLMAIMGREAAYSGKFKTWEQIMASDQNLRLAKNEFGPIPGLKEERPLAGTSPKV